MLKQDFPIFEQKTASGRPLVYLDSGASAQKPRAVIDTIKHFYECDYANVHRGVYELSVRSTELFENTRAKVASFLNAKTTEEIIFTRGATEALNIVAASWAQSNLKPGDEILTTIFEHHSNFVPWQQLGMKNDWKITYIGLTPEERFDYEAFKSALKRKPKLVTLTHISNALGIELPVSEIVGLAHDAQATVLIDAAQSVSHVPINVQALDVDFLVMSGHKLYGPTGTGVLYGKRELLEAMPPFLFGGDMIRSVTLEGTQFNVLPYKFEAGTGNIAGFVGLGAAIEYIERIGFSSILEHERHLMNLLEEGLYNIPQVRVLAPRGEHRGLASIVVDGVHPHDLAQFLDEQGVAVRGGHHCAQPVLRALGLPATTRASLGVYNDESDVERFLEALQKAVSFFGE